MNSVTPSSGIVEFPSSFSPNWTFPSLIVRRRRNNQRGRLGARPRGLKGAETLDAPQNHGKTPEDRVLLVLRETDDVHGLESLGEIGSVVDGRDVETSRLGGVDVGFRTLDTEGF